MSRGFALSCQSGSVDRMVEDSKLSRRILRFCKMDVVAFRSNAFSWLCYFTIFSD